MVKYIYIPSNKCSATQQVSKQLKIPSLDIISTGSQIYKMAEKWEWLTRDIFLIPKRLYSEKSLLTYLLITCRDLFNSNIGGGLQS